jgi:tRNA (mo5U34)-methyltransferase
METIAISCSELREAVSQIHWYHSIDLGNGIVTPGWEKNTVTRLKRLKIPEDLRGLSVLDVGAWDGFFSFEAERRGAKRVLAVDFDTWAGKTWGSKAGFELARKVLGSHVEDLTIDVLDLTPERVGVFDLVLFLGVLYHLRHPLLALERIFSVTGRHLILETHVDMVWGKRPAMVFYPSGELRHDQTNWWGPNPAAVVSMLKSVGFKRVEVVSKFHSQLSMLGAAFYLKMRKGDPFFPTLQQNRMIFHAYRE